MLQNTVECMNYKTGEQQKTIYTTDSVIQLDYKIGKKSTHKIGGLWPWVTYKLQWQRENSLSLYHSHCGRFTCQKNCNFPHQLDSAVCILGKNNYFANEAQLDYVK